MKPKVNNGMTRHPGARMEIIEGPTTRREVDFQADLGFLMKEEGHEGHPYVPPGGKSGVTLDPGLDLGHAGAAMVDRMLAGPYARLLNDAQTQACWRAIGKRGRDAFRAIEEDADLRSIRITFEDAAAILGDIAEPYWFHACERWLELARAPAPVQTGMLSLVYNRGWGNRELEVLTGAISRRDWASVGAIVGGVEVDGKWVGGMQQSRKDGIPARRRREGALIASGAEIPANSCATVPRETEGVDECL